MQSQVTKWGNSLALRLPRHIAADARLHEGTQVELKLEGDSLIVRASRPKYKLAELLENYPKTRTGNREVDWGEAKGEEAW